MTNSMMILMMRRKRKMSKIFRRSNLVENVKGIKGTKNRKRAVIVSFRVSQEERELIDNRIAQMGLSKADFFIHSCMHQEIHVTGNIKTFDEMKRRMAKIDTHLQEVKQSKELDVEILIELRTILELLDNVYNTQERKKSDVYE